MEATLIFPHQLYADHPAIKKDRKIFMIEDPLYFTQYNFHKQKLILHRASMKYYESEVLKKLEVEYIDARKKEAETELLFVHLKKENITTVYYSDTVDYLLERRLRRYASINKIELIRYESPNFLCHSDYIEDYFKEKKNFFLTEFYIAQRKRFKILTDGDIPEGGKWTFDAENRKKIPKELFIPEIIFAKQNKYINEAIEYVNKFFPKNFGKAETFVYPTTHKDAEEWLKKFLQSRFKDFGIYQDAIKKDKNFLFHSLLTPLLNIGLLDPGFIIQKALDAATDYNIPINSLEGFIRQICGWREYMRAVYQLKGVEERKKNFWNHHKKIPASFYNATTGIKPIDDLIKKLENDSYVHHIERLMILGNFMLLNEYDPDDIYKWFMELFIDAYDWVMVPNVYGMSQYADGGMISTKPYISGSNYILKMSDYKKDNWCDDWDALFWHFIYKHRKFFMSNPRMSMMAIQVEKMDSVKFERLMKRANEILSAE